MFSRLLWTKHGKTQRHALLTGDNMNWYKIWKNQVEAYLGYKPTDKELLDAMYEDGLNPKVAAQEYAEWVKVENNLK